MELAGMQSQMLVSVPVRLASLIVLLGAIICAVATSSSFAQNESSYTIGFEASEVVVPVVVLDRTHVRLAAQSTYEELDEEITNLAAGDFQVFEDGVERPVHNVSLELPHVIDVQDNVSRHLEYSFTPAGFWSSPDVWPPSALGPALHLLPIYFVSYEPPPTSRGSCHRIRVKVKRRHATVYARDEYCNIRHSSSDPLAGTDVGRRMERFANSAEHGQFPVSVQVGWLLGNAGGNRVDVALKFPWSAIKREWHRVNLYAMVAILGVLRDRNGKIVARFSDIASTLPWNFYRGPLPPDPNLLMRWEFAAIPTRYETQLNLPTGDYDLRLVVTDGQEFGRVDVPVNVGGRHDDSFAVSGTILCDRFHEVLEGMRAAARAPQYVPLLANGREFTPAAGTRFMQSQPLISYFEIYKPVADATQGARFRIRVTDMNTGELRIDSDWQTVETGFWPRNRATPVTAKLSTDNLSPGNYSLEVQASDSTGRIMSRHLTSFVIE